MPVAVAMIQDAWVLQIPARLAPSILVDDICERNTANRPKPAHRIPDRKQRIRVDAGRKAQSSLRFLLELQIKGCQSRAEAECSRRQQHVWTAGYIDDPAVRVGVPPSRQETIETGAS